MATDDWRNLPATDKLALMQRLRERANAWEHLARPEQLPPARAWYLWLLVGGRGSGKTRSGAEWLAGELAHDRAGDVSAILAPTFRDARDTCVEEHSGLLAALARRGIQCQWNRTDGELQLGNGAVVLLDGADDGALRIQGKNLRRAWCDELGLWTATGGVRAWDESLLPAVRLGEPRIVVTTTPKATQLVRRLLNDPRAVVARMSTYDNRANLAPTFIDEIRRRYAGTRLGRQELDGLLVEDVEGALWRHQWIDDNRAEGPPHGGWQRVVVGVDPGDGVAGGAEHAYTVAALGTDHDIYVLESEGTQASPLEFARRALRATADHDAVMVIERNHGGNWLLEVVDRAQRELSLRVPYRVVNATSGKRTRGEPVAALYEQGHVHHMGEFPILEEQMTAWTGTGNERSPDRLDSLVWAINQLAKSRIGQQPPPSSAAVVRWEDAPKHTDPAVIRWDDNLDTHPFFADSPAGGGSLVPEVLYVERTDPFWDWPK